MTTTFARARRDDLLIQEAMDELLIYDKDSLHAHCLNPTAATIFVACDGNTSITSLARIVTEKTGVVCDEDMVWVALNELESRNLLDVVPAFSAELISRRNVMAIGLAAALITTIMVPTAVMAASGAQGPQGPQGAQGF